MYHPFSNLSRNFTAVLTRAHAHTSCFSFREALRDKLLRKLRSVTGPQHQISATCNAKFSTLARQVAEKFAQCNRALRLTTQPVTFIKSFQLLATGHIHERTHNTDLSKTAVYWYIFVLAIINPCRKFVNKTRNSHVWSYAMLISCFVGAVKNNSQNNVYLFQNTS